MLALHFFRLARPVTTEGFFSQVYVRITDMYIAVSVAESREKFNIISISHHLHQQAYTSKVYCESCACKMHAKCLMYTRMDYA